MKKWLVLFSPLLHLCDIIDPCPVPLVLHVSESNPESILPLTITGFHILDYVTHIFLKKKKKKRIS